VVIAYANGDVATASQAILVTVDTPKATPALDWGTPADITYGTPLDASQLDATASVPGTFAYSPAAGTILGAAAGQMLTVTFTPSDPAAYNSVTTMVPITVARATPTITWANPAGIPFGTSLGAAQLDATASVPGVFTYTHGGGTILNAGADQTLAVTFTPTDTKDYTTATAYDHINVDPPPLVTVTSVQVETVHLTKRKTATDIVITFSGGLDSADADNLGNYHLAAPSKGKTYSKRIGLKSVVYGPAADEVTLQVSGKLALSPSPQLRITATGILDASGRALDGNDSGQPGGDYVALLTKGGAQPQVVKGAETFVRHPHRFPLRP
jgi:hypothetical protein